MDKQKPSVLIADDHPLFRQALALSVATAINDATVREADSLETLITHLQSLTPDLILLDLHMPGAQGFSALVYLRQQYPHLPILIVSASSDQLTISRALHFGANGFAPKSLPARLLSDALIQVLAGQRWLPPGFHPVQADTDDHGDLAAKLNSLTPQQFRVMSMVADGMLNKQIAYELNLSEATVKIHVSAVIKKLGVGNRTQVVIALSQLKAAEPSAPVDD